MRYRTVGSRTPLGGSCFFLCLLSLATFLERLLACALELCLRAP
jgi:hypothetical protein